MDKRDFGFDHFGASHCFTLSNLHLSAPAAAYCTHLCRHSNLRDYVCPVLWLPRPGPVLCCNTRYCRGLRHLFLHDLAARLSRRGRGDYQRDQWHADQGLVGDVDMLPLWNAFFDSSFKILQKSNPSGTKPLSPIGWSLILKSFSFAPFGPL